MPRRALLVGINTYNFAPKLDSAVADAEAMSSLLGYNHDRKLNYECRALLDKMEDGSSITRSSLRKACRELFTDFKDDLLFYFSGHGVLTPFGGYLCTTDSKKDDWGVHMDEIMKMCMDSRARDIVVILDCCHSGDIANPSIFNTSQRNDPLALLREDMTVIAASRDTQVSAEAGGHGLFTAAVLDALEGGAADHMGWVTAPSIYSYVERRFGSWDHQHPVYKSHATKVTVIRQCAPLIERLKLDKLVELFATPDYKYLLDPEYEPEDEYGNVHEPINEQKVAIAQLFKEFRDAGLLKPSTAGEQLFWTARRSHPVELTLRGREYWSLVHNKKI
jgi:Caspase domain